MSRSLLKEKENVARLEPVGGAAYSTRGEQRREETYSNAGPARAKIEQWANAVRHAPPARQERGNNRTRVAGPRRKASFWLAVQAQGGASTRAGEASSASNGSVSNGSCRLWKRHKPARQVDGRYPHWPGRLSRAYARRVGQRCGCGSIR
jgi:hypothetical protein